ncbi:MAG: glycosyltransferase family 4 protein [Omnitrophica bacterium]|nr:glycosyltransferase family 4 protein [Candidatus Omnitrophota bacterium]
MNMKVLLLTTHLNIGGVAVYTVNLARELKKRGISVFVASSGGDLVKALKKEGIVHLPVNVNTKFEFNPCLLPAFFELRKFVKENKIDIIHAQTRVTQVLAHLLSGASSASYVSTCHGFFKKERLGRKLFNAWGDHCIAISDVVREHLVKDLKVKKEHVFLIYNGVDVERFAPHMGEKEKGLLRNDLGFARSPVIGSVSRLSPVKGLKYLLFAMKDILKEEPSCHLLLVGEGPSRAELLELSKRLGIESNVFFAMNTTETERFLSIIDVFVFYSLEEGLGLSLLEALAAGKPCVASNVGGVSSVVEDDVTGLLVPPKDTHALKEAIIKVLRDDDLKRRLAKRGSEMVKEKFLLSKMTGEVLDVYEKARQKK